MLESCFNHESERMKQGIPPLPLTPQETDEICNLLEAPPQGKEELLINLLKNRIAPGVDPAAKDIMLRKPKNTKQGLITKTFSLKVLYTGVLIAAATLSSRYISDRFLPDKAIDLIDEASSRLRMEIDSIPVEIDEVERKIIQLEIEKQALKKEKDSASQERLNKIEKELSSLKEKRDAMKLKWKNEKESIQKKLSLNEKYTLIFNLIHV